VFRALAGAQVGPRNFTRARVTVGPKETWPFSPGWWRSPRGLGQAFSFIPGKQVSRNTGILLANALGDASRRRLQASSGADDMEINAKW